MTIVSRWRVSSNSSLHHSITQIQIKQYKIKFTLNMVLIRSRKGVTPPTINQHFMTVFNMGIYHNQLNILSKVGSIIKK